MSKAKACVTDSGSMQEEMNYLGVPCITLRFGSDRSETFFAGSNVLAPPISAKIIANIIFKVISDDLLKNAPRIYGNNVSSKCAEIISSFNNIDITEESRIFN